MAGLLLDRSDAWGDLAFIPNIYTSLISFLIGLPVAFYIIATVIGSRDETANRVKVERLTTAAWQDFLTAVDEYPDQFYTGCFTHASTLMAELKGAMENIAQLNADNNPNAEALAHADLKWRAQAVHAHLVHISGSEGMFEPNQWRAVADSWKWLEQTVRSRRTEAGLPWLSIRAQAQLGGAIDGPNPALALFVGIRPADVNTNMLTTTGELASYLEWLADQDWPSIYTETYGQIPYPRRRGEIVEKWFEEVLGGHMRWETIKTYAAHTDSATMAPRN